MRVLLNITLPHDEFNAAVKNGTAGAKLKRIIDEAKPEAVYFTDHNGMRSVVMAVALSAASQIPALAEPWFLVFKANVEFKVVMTPEDLAKAGLDDLGKKWA